MLPHSLDRLAQELAGRLLLSRPLVCVDLEATGVLIGFDRIVQIATATVFPDGRVETWSSIVNPEQPIPAEATAVHGISDSIAIKAPTFAKLASTIASRLAGCDLAGFNVDRFDRRLLAAEFARVGVADPTVGARIIDAYTLFVRKEQRSLAAALRFYGVEEDPGRREHEASSDVAATLAVLVAQLKAYADAPRTVDALCDWISPKHPDWIDADGKLVWRDGVATIGFGKQAGKQLADLAAIDRGFLDWILRSDFSDEVKALVRDALAGRFPVRRGGEGV